MSFASTAHRQLWIIGAFVAIYGLVVVLVKNPYYQLILTLIPIWAAFAVSWNIFSGYSGLMSFGQAAFFGVGAYTVTLLLTRYGITPWFGIPAGTIVGAIAAVIIGFPTFRLRGYYFALAMLAYPLAILNVFEWLELQEVPLPMMRDAPAAYMQFSDQRIYSVIAVGILVVAMLISLAIEKSRFGMSLTAIKQNEPAAEAAGINTWRWKMSAFVVSGALAATVGGYYAVVLLIVTPASVFGMLVSAQPIVMTMFGGIGSLWGPVIGAAVLIPLSEVARSTLEQIVPGVQSIVYGIAIVLVVFFAPEGILWRIRDLFAKPAPDVPADASAVEPMRSIAAQPAAPAGAAIMQVEGLGKSFGGLRAVENVTFEVKHGEVLGIIGPNGAGKTTLLNLLNGFLPSSAGTVTFGGKRISGLRPNQICHRGVSRTFQVARPFGRMSVLENVAVGALAAEAAPQDVLSRARAALAQVGLLDKSGALASVLTTKELRLMELARALASRPQLLLVDETLAGLGSGEVDDVVGTLIKLRAQGLTVVIIEHTMHAMLKLCDRLLVLDHGQVLTMGEPRSVIQEPQVIEAYLGKKWMAAGAAS